MAGAHAAAMTDWSYNDESIASSDLLYRRVPGNPNMTTYDPVADQWTVHPGALRRESCEGMSTHLHSILVSRRRPVDSLYPATCGTICFEVAVPRRLKAGVLCTDAPEETDEDLAAAHSEVRPAVPERDRVHWKNVVNEIAQAACWITLPPSQPAV